MTSGDIKETMTVRHKGRVIAAAGLEGMIFIMDLSVNGFYTIL